MAIVPNFPPGWYRTSNELPYGKLTLVTDQATRAGARERWVIYELVPRTFAGGPRLVCYRQKALPGDVRRDCAVSLEFPPAEWRGMPTRDAVATAEKRAETPV